MAKAKTRPVRKFAKLVTQVEQAAPTYAALDDSELRAVTGQLRQRLAEGETLDDLLVDAFAAAREAADRELGMRPYPVQLYGAVVLNDGAIAEMRTGEGKTLTATLPVYLNALAGPVDVVTANAYLAERDARWMGQVYRRLGLTCSPVLAGMSREAKKAAYGCDIVYSTANELGFDYLRDRLALSRSAQVCTERRRAFVIVDEADQVLLDDAKTPLIISGLAQSPEAVLADVNAAVVMLDAGARDEDTGEETGDYVADRAAQTIHLTEAGLARVEATLGLDDLYANPTYAYRVHAALEAHGLLQDGREYLVADGHVLIVDPSTGRTMRGRRFGKGLHEALEAKHDLKVRPETRTQATISVQNFFRLYERMSGMTGTASEASAEFASVYELDVHVIETNKPIARIDEDDVMYLSREAKLAGVLTEVRQAVETGQPVLLGAADIGRAEELSKLLAHGGIDHELLSARDHRREADIIAQAGRPGQVTVATSMAGRGTDILLGGDVDRLVGAAVAERVAELELERASERDDAADQLEAELVEAVTEQERAAIEAAVRPAIEAQVAADRQAVIDAGGLLVLGTERYHSRRVDNQLRGRAGRQGEPGRSVFYVSLEDDLLSLFSETPLEWAVNKLSERGDDDALESLDASNPTASIKSLPGADKPIHHPMMGKAVAGAQRRIEGMRAAARASVSDLDDVVSDQRNAVYGRREELLSADDDTLVQTARRVVAQATSDLLGELAPLHGDAGDADLDHLVEELRRFGVDATAITQLVRDGEIVERDALVGPIRRAVDGRLAAREVELGSAWPSVVRTVMVKTLGEHWVDLIGDLDIVKDAIGWRSMAQRDPVTEFRYEAHARFTEFAAAVAEEQAARLLTVAVRVTDKGA